MEFHPINKNNQDLVHNIYTGKAIRRFTDFGWFWLGLRKRERPIDCLIIYSETHKTAIGMIAFGPHAIDKEFREFNKEYAEIYLLAIDKDFQGLGLGRQALIECCYDLFRKNYKRVIYSPNAKNEAAIGLLKSIGFVENGTNHFGDPLYLTNRSPERDQNLSLSLKPLNAKPVDQINRINGIKDSRISEKRFDWSPFE